MSSPPTPGPGNQDLANGVDDNISGAIWASGQPANTRYLHVMPPNTWSCRSGLQMAHVASSRHPGGGERPVLRRLGQGDQVDRSTSTPGGAWEAGRAARLFPPIRIEPIRRVRCTSWPRPLDSQHPERCPCYSLVPAFPDSSGIESMRLAPKVSAARRPWSRSSVFCSCAGCGDGKPSVDSSLTEATVTGLVSVKGKPATGGTIRFNPSNSGRIVPYRSARDWTRWQLHHQDLHRHEPGFIRWRGRITKQGNRTARSSTPM